MTDFDDKTPTSKPNGRARISDAARELANLSADLSAVAVRLLESSRDIDLLSGRGLFDGLTRRANQARAIGGLGHDVGRALEAIRDELEAAEGEVKP